MKRTLAVLLLLFPLGLFAQPLDVVNVSAPAVNHVFSPSGTITVTDTSSPIWGGGFLQSRYFKGQPGSPAAGKYVYEYRVDLRNSLGITAIGAITSLTVNFGPNVGTLDFSGDRNPDDVFVITGGGLGNKGLSSAVRAGTSITFTFSGGGIAQGGSPGRGDSSYFFGIVSTHPKHNVTVTATNTVGPALSLNAWAPLYRVRAPSGGLKKKP
ncbi:MAG: hypothetical protein AABO58_14340 [Acidobacteriota bacterium]